MSGVRLPSGRMAIFILEICYLLALAGIFSAYQLSASFRSALPASLGALPLGVPWFGAVGGTLISLTGVFKHGHDWNPHLELWHWGRPLVGAFLGSLGGLMFLVIVDSAAMEPRHMNATVFEVVAFLVGYREASFRSLIQRATDLLLSPGAETPSKPAARPALDAGASARQAPAPSEADGS